MPSTASAIRRALPSLALLVGVLLLAADAYAQNTYSVNKAFWLRNSGRFTNVPFIGNTISNCPDASVPRLMTATGTMVGATPVVGPMTSIPSGIAPAAPYGCPTATSGMITATTALATANGAGGAFTLPTHLITRPTYGMLVTVNLPYATNLIQAATDGHWRIPHSARAFGMTSTAPGALGMMAFGGPGSIGPVGRLPAMCIEATCTNLATFRKFQQSAWKGGPMSTFNGQTGRAGANFTWCFGDGTAGTLGCTTILQASAANQMLVRYQAGPRGFGGTSNQLTSTSIVGSLFANTGGGLLLNILDSGAGRIQVQGRGYADFVTDYLTAATTTWMTYSAGPAMVMGPGGSFTIPSKIMTLMGTGMLPIPNQYNQNYGFPLTTGTVLVRAVDMNPLVVTITGMGSDTATVGGARNISLVTGALSNLSVFQNNTPTFSRMILNLPEPGGIGGLAVGVVALLGMATWRARKNR